MGIIINMTKCFGQGEDYSSNCANAQVSSPFNQNSAKNFVNYCVGILTSAINLLLSGGLQMVPAGSANNMDRNDLVKAVLAGRCVLTTGITDTWKLIMAVFYALRAFRLEAYVSQGLDAAYPTLCACKNMVNSWSNMFGSGGSTTADALSNCSEAGSS